jgi:CubicO group peptidase (beta-lactamase class C family)
MEDDAYMRLTVTGQEVAHGGLSATLRDIARFGMFAIDGGVLNGRHIVPPGWFREISRGDDPNGIRAPGKIEIAPDFGYTYHWWTLPRGRASYELGDDDTYAALGIYGQQIYVVPKQSLVVVMQSANVIGRDPPLFTRGRELAKAIAQQLKHESPQ